MSRKGEIDEIWERLNELDGTIRAHEALLIRLIAGVDDAAPDQQHAPFLAECIGTFMSKLRDTPPNEEFRVALSRLRQQLQLIDEANRTSGEAD